MQRLQLRNIIFYPIVILDEDIIKRQQGLIGFESRNDFTLMILTQNLILQIVNKEYALIDSKSVISQNLMNNIFFIKEVINIFFRLGVLKDCQGNKEKAHLDFANKGKQRISTQSLLNAKYIKLILMILKILQPDSES
ncbi:unnamed protein product [Paramecium primaurelia]|uniref:Uncharacterized protein n=1 Tax=Paramecium primaurelia TaxID=5886 RepID=A0A8S1LRY0_PARPR|nr:unnamed protein product [Paramecium primaurelia]